MERWSSFAASAPELATAGRALIYQYGPGLGFLATVRPDGGPRLHPFCPILWGDGLYALVGHSPKLRDLLRDGRFAFHAFPPEATDDEFYASGCAREVVEPAEIAGVRAKMLEGGATSSGDERCFELLLESALHAKYESRGQWPPAYTKWWAPK